MKAPAPEVALLDDKPVLTLVQIPLRIPTEVEESVESGMSHLEHVLLEHPPTVGFGHRLRDRVDLIKTVIVLHPPTGRDSERLERVRSWLGPHEERFCAG